MADFLCANYRDAEYGAEECVAMTEDDLRTCPCRSCNSWRLRQEANQVYELEYQSEMDRIKVWADDPYYSSQDYLSSTNGL